MKKLSLKRIIIFSRLQVTGIYGKNIWKILGLATSLPVILVLVSFLVQRSGYRRRCTIYRNSYHRMRIHTVPADHAE